VKPAPLHLHRRRRPSRGFRWNDDCFRSLWCCLGSDQFVFDQPGAEQQRPFFPCPLAAALDALRRRRRRLAGRTSLRGLHTDRMSNTGITGKGESFFNTEHTPLSSSHQLFF